MYWDLFFEFHSLGLWVDGGCGKSLNYMHGYTSLCVFA